MTSSSSATSRRQGRWLHLLAGLFFLALTAPFWLWIPGTVWYAYIKRIPFVILKKGLRGELEMVQKPVARHAYRYFWTHKKASPTKQGAFPCVGQGWICAPAKPACASGSPQYKPDLSRWRHPCWKKLGFQIPGPHFLQYCYRATGKGHHARYQIRATGALQCEGKPQVFLLTRRAFSSHVSLQTLSSRSPSPASRPRPVEARPHTPSSLPTQSPAAPSSRSTTAPKK